jgi:putative endonuclease
VIIHRAYRTWPAPRTASSVSRRHLSRAAAFLIAKGFRILARRWRSPLGEIDIVARRRQLLVFAEVKARASLDEAAESVNERQRRRRIVPAVEVWLAAIRTITFAISASTRSWWRRGKIPHYIPAAFETN